MPDLKATAITDPPATVGQGQSFNLKNTVTNVGPVSSAASATRYYLVTR